MKTKILRNLFLASMYLFTVQTNAQVSNQLRDSLSILLNNKIVYVGVNKIVKYDKIYDGKAFFEERILEKGKILDTIFIRNDSLITKYKEEHHSWISYGGKKHRNLYDPSGYICAAIIDLKLSIVYINKGNWEGALPGAYTNAILIDSKNKRYSSNEFPYRSLNFTGTTVYRYTNKKAKELDDANTIISLFNMYVSQMYNGKLESFKTKANQQNNSSNISEEQRKLIVQANLANEEKNYEKALELYEKSLIINEFNYPESYFNMALIASQLVDYPLAVFNMKKYLILSPDAGDSRKALDKIYEWEFKINNN
jgi:tetratricopeptide (TPR) repeat protein